MIGTFFYYLDQFLCTAVPRMFARIYRSGFERVPKTGGGLVLCNHISHFDPPLLTVKFPRQIHFMADKPLLDLPVFGKMLAWGHVFPIDRTKNDIGALRTAIAKLRAGQLVGIFPEQGIRYGNYSVLHGAELPVGTASLWKMSEVPVIPMVILGSDQLYHLKGYLRRPRVFIRVGNILPPDKKATREELRERIQAEFRPILASLVQDYQVQPEEFPQSAHRRWGQPEPEVRLRGDLKKKAESSAP